MAVAFDVPPELACPLCLDLLHEPVLTPCRHSFCRACIDRARGAGHNSCPLCRAALEAFDARAAPLDAAAVDLLASVVPAELLERRRQRWGLLFQVVVSNLHEAAPDRGRNSNKWTMLVNLQGAANQHAATLIEKVVYHLHPTFNPSVVTALPPHFSLCRYGWGTFDVRCDIHWNPRLALPPTRVEHCLSFQDGGGRTMCQQEIDPSALNSAGINLRSDDGSAVLEVASHPQPDESAEPPRPADEPVPRPLRGPYTGWAAPLRSLPLEVIVGNTCEAAGDRFRWKMYVMLPQLQRFSTRMIDRVVYKLHPSFDPDMRERRSPDFTLTMLGWGTFTVGCTIHWHRQLQLAPTVAEHELCFEGDGGRTLLSLAVSAQGLAALQRS